MRRRGREEEEREGGEGEGREEERGGEGRRGIKEKERGEDGLCTRVVHPDAATVNTIKTGTRVEWLTFRQTTD